MMYYNVITNNNLFKAHTVQLISILQLFVVLRYYQDSKNFVGRYV